ncbi:MAG: signal peptidase II [Erysipelotrichaceae bacterium]|nr:signal peptidase II [Erysipelotrichaceae bacterium]
MKTRDYLFIILLVVIDQLSKLYVTAKMTLHQSIEVIRNFFYITYTRNSGAAWSLLQGQKLFFIITAAVAVVVIVIYISRSRCSFWEKLGLLLIAGGAIGNVIDRIRLSEVIDFLDFYIFGYDFPIFNIADSCITVGGIIVAATILLDRREKA